MGMCLIAALDLTSVLYWTVIVLKVAFALGAVIFVHELGHYLVARACGVKIEKFMIGFDIGGYKLSWRRGETVYGIGIVPLGGYVKMLGQDDDPAHIAEQMQKSQVSAGSPDAVEIIGPNGEKYLVDRRSYLAKSVPQRMAIISAGVVMNVIFAFIFATIAYGMGVPYLPCIVAETAPGSPAWREGLEPGDEIIQLGELVNPTFTQLRGGVTLGDLEEGIPIVVRRAEDGSEQRLTLTPEQKNGGLAMIGIVPSFSLTVVDTFDHSPASRARLVAPPATDLKTGKPQFQDGDQIVRVGEVAVKNYRDLSIELARQPDQPLRIAVRRPVNEAGDQAGHDEKREPDAEQHQELVFEVPAQPLYRFGLVMELGPITAVQAKSPAKDAGLRAGDVIIAVDGKSIGEGNGGESWDGATLPDYLRRAASEGRTVAMTIHRPADGQGGESFDVQITPQQPIMVNSPFPMRAPRVPMEANEIGIAYRIENEVVAVKPDTPAAQADLRPGDTIVSATVRLPQDRDGETPEPVTVKFVQDDANWLARLIAKVFGGELPAPRTLPNWPQLMDAVQFAPTGTDVEFTVKRDADAEPLRVKLETIVDDAAFVAARGFWFRPVERIREAESFAQQLKYGWDETAEALTMVFRFLQKLGGQVPLSALGGPITIAKVAGYSAAEGVPTLLIFLTMLSANLAVLNFLPIPLLDGGHMVFLAYEWIRGRPANEKFVVALHTAGFIFIVTLMLYVLSLDLGLIPRGL